jgi:glycosyltransferase involved in cell wall biosynthesis
MATDKPKIVISAVNLTEAGPLSILTDCLDYAARALTDRYDIVALVHKAQLVRAPGVRVLEFPASKRSWLIRLYYEYLGFLPLSRRLEPYLWLSLHDMTPNVRAQRRAVYFHNPAPFFRLQFKDVVLEPRFSLFVLLYGLLYSINLLKNRYVVVQQDWIRQEVKARYGAGTVIVAHPEPAAPPAVPTADLPRRKARTVFFYPTAARYHKNIEVIGLAVQRLVAAGLRNFEVRITIDGRENRYARRIAAMFGAVPEMRLLGRQTRDAVYALYREADCLVFPSRLETWGLPITEFKPLGKPILVADCRYAAETVGDYGNAALFGPGDADGLSDLMRSVIENRFRPQVRPAVTPGVPFARNWAELFKILLSD